MYALIAKFRISKQYCMTVKPVKHVISAANHFKINFFAKFGLSGDATLRALRIHIFVKVPRVVLRDPEGTFRKIIQL